MEKILGYDISNVVFTIHAKKRMSRRKIVPEIAYHTLSHPTITLPRYEDNTQEFRRKMGNRTHFVVVDYSQKGILKIITTGWSREA